MNKIDFFRFSSYNVMDAYYSERQIHLSFTITYFWKDSAMEDKRYQTTSDFILREIGEEAVLVDKTGTVVLFAMDKNSPSFYSKEIVHVLPVDVDFYRDPVSMNTVNEMLALVNRARSQYNLVPLRVCEDLQAAAAVRANEIVEKVAHERLDGSPCLNAMQYKGRVSGENIAAGQKSVQEVFDGWMNSEGHRKNILNPAFHEIGIGYYKLERDHKYNTYWVQLFRG